MIGAKLVMKKKSYSRTENIGTQDCNGRADRPPESEYKICSKLAEMIVQEVEKRDKDSRRETITHRLGVVP